MKKISVFFTILLIILGWASAEALEIRISGDKLSLSAKQVPLQDILQRIADMGISIQADPEVNPVISASFENRDMQDGLYSILKSLNHVLIWESVRGVTGSIPRLAEIQIFRPGKKELMKPFGRRSALSIARNPRDGSFFVRDEILLRLKPGATLPVGYKGKPGAYAGTSISTAFVANRIADHLSQNPTKEEILNELQKP